MSDAERTSYRQVTKNKLQTMQLTNWTKNDIIVATIIFLLMAAVSIWAKNVIAGVFVFLFTFVLLVRLKDGYGRVYSEIAVEFRSFIYDEFLEGDIWLAEDTGGRFAKWYRSRRPPIPLRFDVIEAITDGVKRRYSLLHQTDRPFDHMFIAAEGGKFDTYDVNEQMLAVDRLAEIKNNVINSQKFLRVGISYVRITGPYDTYKMAEYLRKGMDPVIGRPEVFDLSESLRGYSKAMLENANTLQATASKNGASKNWMLIVITIKRTSALRRAIRSRTALLGAERQMELKKRQAKRRKSADKREEKARLIDELIYDLPIIEMTRTLVEDLAEDSLIGLKNVRALQLAELSNVIRCGWDTVGIQQYYQDRNRGLIPRNDEEIDEFIKAQGDISQAELSRRLNRLLQAWPRRHIKTSKKDECIILDDNWISTVRVTKMPSMVRSDQFMRLHRLARLNRWTRSASVAESAKGDTEVWTQSIEASARANFQEAFFSARRFVNPKHRTKMADLMRQIDQSAANSIIQHYNKLETVMGSSARDMVLGRNQIQTQLKNAGFETEVVSSTGRLMDAIIGGCFGVNRF